MSQTQSPAAAGEEDVGVRYRVTYAVEEVRGWCPLYSVGDKVVIDGQETTETINLALSDAVCLRALDNMWDRHTWLRGKDEKLEYHVKAASFVRAACPMPGQPYTPCGYTIFRATREPITARS
jgi:uncharacterized repeat protein (TIGR04076 family)